MLAQWQPAQLVPLLYQTGYLTLIPTGELAPPNREVATYLSRVLLEPWIASREITRATGYQAEMVDALRALNLPRMVEKFNALLHLLAHQRFHGTEHSACNLALDLAVMLSHGRIRYHEMEKSGLQGDADTTIVWDDISMVLEFKTGTHAQARTGQRQIQDRNYLLSLPCDTRLYLGLSLYTAGRKVVAWECQGYAPNGEPVRTSLTEQDVWPACKDALYQRWTVHDEDLQEPPAPYTDGFPHTSVA